MDLKRLIKEEKELNEIKNVKLVANLPYYITTPIIMKLVENTTKKKVKNKMLKYLIIF